MNRSADISFSGSLDQICTDPGQALRSANRDALPDDLIVEEDDDLDCPLPAVLDHYGLDRMSLVASCRGYLLAMVAGAFSIDAARILGHGGCLPILITTEPRLSSQLTG